MSASGLTTMHGQCRLSPNPKDPISEVPLVGFPFCTEKPDLILICLLSQRTITVSGFHCFGIGWGGVGCKLPLPLSLSPYTPNSESPRLPQISFPVYVIRSRSPLLRLGRPQILTTMQDSLDCLRKLSAPNSQKSCLAPVKLGMALSCCPTSTRCH